MLTKTMIFHYLKVIKELEKYSIHTTTVKQKCIGRNIYSFLAFLQYNVHYVNLIPKETVDEAVNDVL